MPVRVTTLVTMHLSISHLICTWAVIIILNYICIRKPVVTRMTLVVVFFKRKCSSHQKISIPTKIKIQPIWMLNTLNTKLLIQNRSKYRSNNICTYTCIIQHCCYETFWFLSKFIPILWKKCFIAKKYPSQPKIQPIEMLNILILNTTLLLQNWSKYRSNNLCTCTCAFNNIVCNLLVFT